MAKPIITANKTRGDVIRINVTPYRGRKTSTFPWVRIFNHPRGIRHAAAKIAIEEGPSKDESKKEFAQRLGLKIIRQSKILVKWFQ